VLADELKDSSPRTRPIPILPVTVRPRDARFAAPVQGGDRACRPSAIRRHTFDTLWVSNSVPGRAAASSDDRHLRPEKPRLQAKQPALRCSLHGQRNAYHGSALSAELRGRVGLRQGSGRGARPHPAANAPEASGNPAPSVRLAAPPLTGGPYRVASGASASCCIDPPTHSGFHGRVRATPAPLVDSPPPSVPSGRRTSLGRRVPPGAAA
jgi:hypothetical protein